MRAGLLGEAKIYVYIFYRRCSADIARHAGDNNRLTDRLRT